MTDTKGFLSRVRFVFACAFMQTTHRVLCPGSGHQHNGHRGERRVQAGRGQQRKEMCKREKIEMKNTIWLQMWTGPHSEEQHFKPRENTREGPMFLLTWMCCWSSFTMHMLGPTPLILRYIYQLHWILSSYSSALYQSLYLYIYACLCEMHSPV